MSHFKVVAATQHDIPIIMDKVAQLYEKSTSPMKPYYDLMEAELSIRDAIHSNGCTLEVTDNCRAVLADGYFIMFSVSPMWWSSKLFLIEELVIRVGPTVRGKSAVLMTLYALCKKMGCVKVIAGDGQSGIMGQAYLDAGYVKAGEQYVSP